MRAVVDASVAVDSLVPGLRRTAALAALAEVEAVAPDLVTGEVLSALARLERAGTVTSEEATDAVTAWTDAPVDHVPSALLATRVWRLRGALRVADAFYVALALELGVPLLTSDARLTRAPLPPITITLVR